MEKFRLLNADEIECRIATIKDSGLTLLLYKDARVDQNILDETVGPLNWQRSHSRDNANCTVSIWDETKNQWISKEDTGKESNTEAEKGLASDSFKRACFNWGIGRELYTAPFIWIDSKKAEIKQNNGRYACYDKFEVKSIEYDEKRNITGIVIINSKTREIVFRLGKVEELKEEPKKAEPVSNKVDGRMILTLQNEFKKRVNKDGSPINIDSFLKYFKVNTLEDMTIEQYKNAMAMLKSKCIEKDKINEN